MHYIIRINILNFQKRNNLKKSIDLLSAQGILLKSLEEINLATLNSRKKLKIFSGVNDKKYFVVIFYINQKSRFVLKNAKEIVDLEKRLEKNKNHVYKKKYVILESPLCSRAKIFLADDGWHIFE